MPRRIPLSFRLKQHWICAARSPCLARAALNSVVHSVAPIGTRDRIAVVQPGSPWPTVLRGIFLHDSKTMSQSATACCLFCPAAVGACGGHTDTVASAAAQWSWPHSVSGSPMRFTARAFGADGRKPLSHRDSSWNGG